MKFKYVPRHAYFVVADPEKSSLLLAKDSNGRIRMRDGWKYFHRKIHPDTEVQLVHIREGEQIQI